MSEVHNEGIDSPNDDEMPEEDPSVKDQDIEEGDDIPDDDPDDNSGDDSDDVKKLKEQNKKLFERAKKAEGFVKDKDGNWVKKAKPALQQKTQSESSKIEITPLDTIALMEAKVTDADDINDVLDYARFKKISVRDALKSNVIKTTLADKAAERVTAQATNTKGSKKGVSSPDADTVVNQASQGQFPDDPTTLAKARMDQKKSKK